MSLAGQRPLDGRTERRMKMTIAVYLADLGEVRSAERALTENVSPLGARVLTKKRWQPGGHVWITFLFERFQSKARVVYCHSLKDSTFCVGLEFQEIRANWTDRLWAGAT
jgi:hypothetical protein